MINIDPQLCILSQIGAFIDQNFSVKVVGQSNGASLQCVKFSGW